MIVAFRDIVAKMGETNVVEAAAAAMTLARGVIPPTINLEDPDDGFDLDFVANTAQERELQFALNNYFGFGGHNVSLVFAKYDGT